MLPYVSLFQIYVCIFAGSMAFGFATPAAEALLRARAAASRLGDVLDRVRPARSFTGRVQGPGVCVWGGGEGVVPGSGHMGKGCNRIWSGGGGA